MDGYTGSLLEEEVFGVCNATDDDCYKPFGLALDFVKRNQPHNPSDPTPRFANDLHAEVALALRLDDWSELKFFTAIGSYLDHKYGVDGWFEWCETRVTLDVTLNRAKESGYKADIIVGQKVVESATAREELASEIALLLNFEPRRKRVFTNQPSFRPRRRKG